MKLVLQVADCQQWSGLSPISPIPFEIKSEKIKKRLIILKQIATLLIVDLSHELMMSHITLGLLPCETYFGHANCLREQPDF